ncbi:MAG: UTP--glucose-1-phosphate uridylyltransferase [Alphaproteobacteria bacterium]|nr:MAG: UTP--glucose-1-phosphate uridylyltransferase [Alphaproteobacteria bacterium]
MKPVRKAVIPVAGLGARFLPATKSVPKEMLPVVDRPLIQYAIDEARAAGIEDFVLVTGRGKSAIEDYFDHAYELEAVLESRHKIQELAALECTNLEAGRIMYTRQQVPLGLGHAVWCARDFVGDEPFAVLLPDDLMHGAAPCLKQMVEAYRDLGGNLVAVMDVPRRHTDRYGIVSPGVTKGRVVEVKGLEEKPHPEEAPSTLSVVGRYILDPAVFTHLSRLEAGAGGEIQLTDALAKLVGTMPFYGYRFEGTRFDCGDKVGYLAANVVLGLERPDLGGEFRDFLKALDLDDAKGATRCA